MQKQIEKQFSWIFICKNSTLVFPPSLLDKDLLTTVFVLPCVSLILLWWNSPECFQCGLFVTLLWRNQVNNSVDLGDYSNEYLKSVIKNNKSNKENQKSLTAVSGEKIEVGRWLDDLTGSTFSVLTPAEYCTCFDVVICYSLRMAIVGVVKETDYSCLDWNISDWTRRWVLCCVSCMVGESVLE